MNDPFSYAVDPKVVAFPKKALLNTGSVTNSYSRSQYELLLRYLQHSRTLQLSRTVLDLLSEYSEYLEAETSIAQQSPVFFSLEYEIWAFQLGRSLDERQTIEIESLWLQFPLIILPLLIETGKAVEWRSIFPADRFHSLASTSLKVKGSRAGLGFVVKFAETTASLHVNGGQLLELSRNGVAAIPSLADNADVMVRTRSYISQSVELLQLSEAPEVLGGCNPTDWCESTNASNSLAITVEAFELIRELWPDGFEEVEGSIKGIVSLDMASGEQGSVSNQQIPALIGVTLSKGNILSIAELILHEAAHIKIDLAQRYAPLIIDDGAPSFKHPWRNDPRPITGVLYAGHAFLTTLALNIYASRSDKFTGMVTRDLDQLATNVKYTIRYLQENANLTTAGKETLREMEEAFSKL